MLFRAPLCQNSLSKLQRMDQNMATYAHMNQRLAEETNGPASNNDSIQNLLGWHWVWKWAEVAASMEGESARDHFQVFPL